MGHNQSHQQNFQLIHMQNWIEADQDQQKILFSNVNPYRKKLLANIITHQIIEQYQLNFIAEEDYNNYLKELNFRKIQTNPQINKQKNSHRQGEKSIGIWRSGYNNSNSHQTNNVTHINPCKYIYPIKYFINKSKKQICTTVYTGLLYIDKVDLRLKQINDIPFLDLIYMYKATFQGFKCLYQKVGYFDIQEEMVFITRKGEVKVWMNSNLSKNYPNFQKTDSITNKSKQGSECIYGSQAQMIKDLIQLIQKNSDENEQLPAPLFSSYLTQRNILDRLCFDYCIEQFHRYLTAYNIYLYDYMKSIAELFISDQNNNTQRTNYDQSHVNQVTTAHINQLKKRFTPMATILEDENLMTRQTRENNLHKDNYKDHHSSRNVFNRLSRNSKNTNSNFIKNSNEFVQTNNLDTFSDMSKSRYSAHSQQQNLNQIQSTQPIYLPKQYNNKSYHLVRDGNQQLQINQLHELNLFHPNPQIHQKSHLISKNVNTNYLTTNSMNNRPSAIKTINHHLFNQNISQNQVTRYQNSPSYLGMKPGNTQINKVVFNSPPLSFRRPGQEINHSFIPTLSSPILTPNIVHMTHRVQSLPIQNISQKVQLLYPSSYPSSNLTNQQQQTNSTNQKKNPVNQHSPTISQLLNNNKFTKSNIQRDYVVSSEYQLDAQIASDLEKFLGLRVN